MKKVLFLGDSITSGENNHFVSFVDYNEYFPSDWQITKLAVSGTTIGEYSIYPVDGYSLLSLIERNKELIQESDIIFLEYGLNDITSIVAENVTYPIVRNSFVKALDYLKQINSTANCYFLALSDDEIVVEQHSRLIRDYLVYNYFGTVELSCDKLFEWTNLYTTFISDVRKKLPVISLVDDLNFFDQFIDVDGIHPTDTGYRKMASVLGAKFVQLTSY